MNIKNVTSALYAAIVLLSLFSCGHRRAQTGQELSRDNQNGEYSEGRNLVWETAWVDPRIILADTAITLFRAGRVDSVQVDAAKRALESATSLEFQIINPTCPIEISLMDTHNQGVSALLSHTLESGFYKVSLNPGVSRRLGIIPGRYKLKVVFCGEVVTKPVLIT
jgi:hypothetical protein